MEKVEIIKAIKEIISTSLLLLNRSTMAPQIGMTKKFTKGFKPIKIPTCVGVSKSCLKYNAK